MTMLQLSNLFLWHHNIFCFCFDSETLFFTPSSCLCDIYLQNIMKYLLSEAKEKEQSAFQKGWKINIIKVICI